MAVHNPGGSVTKHYYAGGQPLATRVDDVLYYTLADPTGTSLEMAKTNGDEVGHVLYDGYGAVLTSTVPATLTTTLAGSGDVADPDTGLVYLGAGRWYDPALGRPLQPDPIGGPPALPPALNRYRATPWGPPGVAEGAASDGFLLRLALSTRNQIPGTLAGLAIDQIAITSVERQIVKRAVPTAWGLVELVHPPTTGFAGIVTRLTQSGVGRSLTGLPLVGNRIAAYYAGRNVRSVQRALLGEAVEGGFAAGEGVAIGHGSMRLLAREVTYVDEVVERTVTRSLGRLGTGLSVFAAGAFAGVIQYAYDYSNPYLTGTQKGFRAVTSAGLGAGATGIALVVEYAIAGSIGGPIGIVGAVVVGVAFELWIAPLIFEAGGAIETRNLAPLE